MEQTRFTLPNFSGPLELLVFLVQKEELELFEVPLCALLEQYTKKISNDKDVALETAADFVSSFSQLIYLKSLRLAPEKEQVQELEQNEPQEEACKTNFVEHLIEYCSFKQLAKTLSVKEEQQELCFLRGKDTPIDEDKRGLETVSLEEFSRLFMEIYKKAEKKKDTIWEEKWKVRDKIHYLRERLKTSTLTFAELFSFKLCREELITIFLAVLELMKNAELELVRTQETQTWIFQSALRR